MVDENKEVQVEVPLTMTSEFIWIQALIKYRINELCGADQEPDLPQMPELQKGVHPYFDELIENEVHVIERVALSLALTSIFFPQYLDYLYTKNQYTDKIFTEFGVGIDTDSGGIKTSWQTVFFLALGTNPDVQLNCLSYIHRDFRLYKENIFVFPEERVESPFLTRIQLNSDVVRKWMYPIELRKLADKNFSAHEISSDLEWSDLFISPETEKGLHQLKLWLEHGDGLMKHPKLKKYINPGIRALFYGPSGTGKTLTASLLGKQFGMPVYRVDLSQMVSKWIGETEKNLARIFDQAEKQKWILFFDEADSLFSKRGSVNSSNDRRANQEISYLLQRVENYDGTIVMATNLKDNIDEAFVRRFQLMINFPVPDKVIRKKLWESILADTFPIDPNLDLLQIAEDYEITGGSMKNIFRSLMLHIIDQKKAKQVVTHSGLEMMIQRELAKSGVYTIKRRY
jgi:AAA+ superfamily predicted ATPase